jgi:hypothetical protein
MAVRSAGSRMVWLNGVDVDTHRRGREPKSLEQLAGSHVRHVGISGGADEAEQRGAFHDLHILRLGDEGRPAGVPGAPHFS